jgi:hypothetical protein
MLRAAVRRLGVVMRTAFFSRVNTFLLALLVLMAGSIIAILARGAIGGPLDPPGAPAPTLPQAEKRSPIPPVGWNGSFPIVLGQGSYYLTQNLIEVFGSAPAIDVQGTNTTLDLNGFFIRGIGTPQAGIASTSGAARITIENGMVEGWSTGIDLSTSDDVRIDGITAWNNSNTGISVGSGSTVSQVTANLNGVYGIAIGDPHSKFEGGMIEDSTVSKNTNTGIQVVANNVTVTRDVVESNGLRGIDIQTSFDVITDNSVQGSQQCINLSLNSGTGNNTIARNITGNCSSSDITAEASGSDHIGPGVSGLNLPTSNPWSNVEY